jgi:DNA anti-recombination protein RmuC
MIHQNEPAPRRPSQGVHRYQSHLKASVPAELIPESLVYPQMPNRTLKLTYGVMLTLGMASLVLAQDNAAQPPARQQLQRIHTPQSIDQQFVRLTQDLELTPQQQQQVRPLLEEHHNRIQALLDKNPNASRQELGTQIHAISEDTHHQIHALLSDHQQQLEKAMQQREHRGEEDRRPHPPAATSPEPSASAP